MNSLNIEKVKGIKLVENFINRNKAHKATKESIELKGNSLKVNNLGGLEENYKGDDDLIDNFIKDNNLPKNLKENLKIMISHNITLTKENIKEFNSFLYIDSKSLDNIEGSIEDLSKYIKDKIQLNMDKDIDILHIRGELREGLGELLKLKGSDIATLIENNIDFKVENLKSYNKIFNGDSEIFNRLKDIESLIDNKETIKDGASLEFTKSLKNDNLSGYILENKNVIVAELKNKEGEMLGIIKRLIGELEIETNKSGVISKFIEENINDFKLFNDFSNEYYYLDLPMNINRKNYGCKLIIKNRRKDGEKIDKNNIKLVLSVKTINLGEVDSLLDFKGKNLRIEIKSIAENINYLKQNIYKLEKPLELLGFMPYIFVSEKVYDTSNISTYREFFNKASCNTLNKLI